MRASQGLFALVIAGCSTTVAAPSSDAGAPREAATYAPWDCPTGWVPLRAGGCAPALRACPEGLAELSACARVDREAPSSAERPWAGVREGRDTPTRDWRPTAGIAQCPAGWSRRDDETCDPNLSTSCSPSAAPLPGGRCTATGERDCPVGAWPELGAEAVRGRVVYARADAAGSVADGTETRPFATLRAALAVAHDGDWIALGDGAYELADTPWPRGVSLAGRCATRVTVTVPRATLRGDLAWRDLTLPGGRVVAEAGSRVALSRVLFDSSAGVAIRASGAALRIDDVWIREPHRGAPDFELAALLLEDGATVTADGFAVTGGDTRSVVVNGSSGGARPTTFTLAHGAFSDTAGSCLDAVYARTTLSDVAFRRVRGDVIRAQYQRPITLTDVSIDNGRATEASAIYAYNSDVVARRLSIRGVQRALHAELGGSLDVDELVAQGCGNCLTLLSGVDGGRASLSRARIRSLGGAPWLFPGRAAVVFRDSDIGMTDDAAAGTSISLFQGSDLAFETSRIDGLALLAISDDVSIRFDRSVLGDARGLVRGTLPLVYMPERQTLRISHSIVTAREGGLVAARGGGSVVVEDSIVRGLRPSATQPEAAITLANGSSAALTRVAFVDNTSVALTVADADSAATLTDVDAQAASPAVGPALFCARGARLDGTRVSLANAWGVALLVDGMDAPPLADGALSTRASIHGFYASRVISGADGSTAIAAQRGADVRVTGATVRDTANALTASGSRVTLTDAALGGLSGPAARVRSEADRASVTLVNVGEPAVVRVDEALPELPSPVLLQSP